MGNFWSIVNKVIDEADIILLVVDARLINETKNKELELKIKKRKKQLITVINKCDLVEKETLETYKFKFHPCVFVSAHKFFGMTLLRKMILRHAKEFPVTVGVVGYPNTGKSSIINSLKGKGSAGVSSVSGYTKGVQNIRVDSKIRVIDTPGVIAESDDKHSAKLAITASKNTHKDPDLVVYELFKEYKEQIKKYYEIKTEELSEEELLEEIAISLNRYKKGNKPDIETTAKMILQDWQKGKIKV
jgi:ribosome biogenesis GTPase A